MTQDPYGQPPGSGHVVRGEVVPDDEADVDPMTHFQKVASALRGNRTDPAMPAVQEADPAVSRPRRDLAGREPGRRDDQPGCPGGGPRRRGLAGG